MEVVRHKEGQRQTLDQSVCPWKRDGWHEVEVRIEGMTIRAGADGATRTVEAGEKMGGGIGFLLEGRTTCYFDNIHVQQVKNFRGNK